MSKKMNQFDVVGLGQCSLDIIGRIDDYPEIDTKTELNETLIQGGGPVATALVTLARLGVSTAFVGKIGDDSFGPRIRSGLISEGVDCEGLVTEVGARSQFAFVAVDQDGHRNIFWKRGSYRPLVKSEIDPKMIVNSRILHLDGLQVEISVLAAKLARKHKITTVLDGGTLRPSMLELMRYIDHAVVSEKFAWQLVGNEGPKVALEKLLEYGCAAATVTLGVKGSWTLTGAGEFFHQPIYDVKVVDTTGCGDVFHGGYIYGLLRQWPVKAAVRFATACAAIKTRKLGGRTAIPTLKEVEAFLHRGD